MSFMSMIELLYQKGRKLIFTVLTRISQNKKEEKEKEKERKEIADWLEGKDIK